MKTLQDHLSVKREPAITFAQTAAQTQEETGAVIAGPVIIHRTPTATSAAHPAMNDRPPTGATAPSGLGPWIASR